MAVSIKLGDIHNRIEYDISRIQKKHEKSVKKAIKDQIDAFLNGAIVNVMLRMQSTNNEYSGELLKSFYSKNAYYRSNDFGALSVWEIGNTAFYAGILEHGSPPHEIKAGLGKKLVFETEFYQPWNNEVRYPKTGRNGGFLKITDSVQHPGHKAFLFFSSSFRDNAGVFEHQLDRYLSQISL